MPKLDKPEKGFKVQGSKFQVEIRMPSVFNFEL
jgi:hypothetical protein